MDTTLDGESSEFLSKLQYKLQCYPGQYKLIQKHLATVFFNSNQQDTSLAFILLCLRHTLMNGGDLRPSAITHLLLELIPSNLDPKIRKDAVVTASELFDYLVARVELARVALKLANLLCLESQDVKDWSKLVTLVQQLLLSSSTYSPAVGLLMQFEGLDEHVDKIGLLGELVMSGQESLAEKWATSLGRDYQIAFVEHCIGSERLKFGSRAVKAWGLQDEFPDIEMTYKRRMISKLVSKNLWHVAATFCGTETVLQEELLKEMAASGQLEIAGHYRQLWNFPEDILKVDPLQLALETSARAAQYLQLAVHPGSVLFIDTSASLQIAVDVLKRASQVGLDVEWKPAVGAPGSNPASILQVATLDTVMVFDLITLKDDPLLGVCMSQVMTNPDVIKLGFAVAGDLRKLHGSYPHIKAFSEVKQVLDLRDLWMEWVLRKRPPGVTTSTKQCVGLSSVARHVLGKPLDKSMQVSDWEARPLSRRQLQYAAQDAHVLLLLYRTLTADIPGSDLLVKKKMFNFTVNAPRAPRKAATGNESPEDTAMMDAEALAPTARDGAGAGTLQNRPSLGQQERLEASEAGTAGALPGNGAFSASQLTRFSEADSEDVVFLDNSSGLGGGGTAQGPDGNAAGGGGDMRQYVDGQDRADSLLVVDGGDRARKIGSTGVTKGVSVVRAVKEGQDTQVDGERGVVARLDSVGLSSSEVDLRTSAILAFSKAAIQALSAVGHEPQSNTRGRNLKREKSDEPETVSNKVQVVKASQQVQDSYNDRQGHSTTIQLRHEDNAEKMLTTLQSLAQEAGQQLDLKYWQPAESGTLPSDMDTPANSGNAGRPGRLSKRDLLQITMLNPYPDAGNPPSTGTTDGLGQGTATEVNPSSSLGAATAGKPAGAAVLGGANDRFGKGKAAEVAPLGIPNDCCDGFGVGMRPSSSGHLTTNPAPVACPHPLDTTLPGASSVASDRRLMGQGFVFGNDVQPSVPLGHGGVRDAADLTREPDSTMSSTSTAYYPLGSTQSYPLNAAGTTPACMQQQQASQVPLGVGVAGEKLGVGCRISCDTVEDRNGIPVQCGSHREAAVCIPAAVRQTLEKHSISYSLRCFAGPPVTKGRPLHTAAQAAVTLGVPLTRIAKSVALMAGGRPVVAVVRGDQRVDLRKAGSPRCWTPLRGV